jgi:hypothetical protein
MTDRWAEVERLASFIMDEIPGEPSQSEGAIDCAIRLLRDQAATIQRVRDLPVRWGWATDRTLVVSKSDLDAALDGETDE